MTTTTTLMAKYRKLESQAQEMQNRVSRGLACSEDVKEAWEAANKVWNRIKTLKIKARAKAKAEASTTPEALYTQAVAFGTLEHWKKDSFLNPAEIFVVAYNRKRFRTDTKNPVSMTELKEMKYERVSRLVKDQVVKG